MGEGWSLSICASCKERLRLGEGGLGASRTRFEDEDNSGDGVVAWLLGVVAIADDGIEEEKERLGAEACTGR